MVDESVFKLIDAVGRVQQNVDYVVGIRTGKIRGRSCDELVLWLPESRQILVDNAAMDWMRKQLK